MMGRYLLDGGKSGESFRAYFRSFMQYPPIALSEWRRIGYAVISLYFQCGKIQTELSRTPEKATFRNAVDRGQRKLMNAK